MWILLLSMMVVLFTSNKMILILIFTACKRSLGQGNMFTGVSVHRGEYLTRYTPQARYSPPRSRHPPGVTPPRSRHPPVQSMLGDTVNARAVRILLECNLVLYSTDPTLTPVYFHLALWCSNSPQIWNITRWTPHGTFLQKLLCQRLKQYNSSQFCSTVTGLWHDLNNLPTETWDLIMKIKYTKDTEEHKTCYPIIRRHTSVVRWNGRNG